MNAKTYKVLSIDAWADGDGGMVEDDGYNLVICDKSDGEPLFAIKYGSEYQ